jgi:hypothetical protein
MGWFKRKKEEEKPEANKLDVTLSAVPKPVPVPESKSEPKPEPEEPLQAKPVKFAKHKPVGRMTLEDVEPFKLGKLQQALMVYYHIIEKGFTFADLVEYVNYATEFQKQSMQAGAQEVAAQKRQKDEKESGQKETPQMMPLTREERKKYRHSLRRR